MRDFLRFLLPLPASHLLEEKFSQVCTEFSRVYTKAIPDHAHRNFTQKNIYFMVPITKVSICSAWLIPGNSLETHIDATAAIQKTEVRWERFFVDT